MSAQQGLTRTVSILLVYTVVCFVFLKIETTPYFVLFTCILIVINRKVKNANTKPKYEVDLTRKKSKKKKNPVIENDSGSQKGIPIVLTTRPTVFKIGSICSEINCTYIRDFHIAWNFIFDN